MHRSRVHRGRSPAPDSSWSRLTTPASGPGQQIPSSAREAIEPVVGHSLADIRIFPAGEPSRVAGELGLRAATFDRGIVFAPGAYAPETPRGLRLLAHEAAHVGQQRRSSAAPSVQLQDDREKANSSGRKPSSEDLKRLADLDLAEQVLEEQRRQKVDEVRLRFDDHLLPYERTIDSSIGAGTLTDPGQIAGARGYIDDRKKVWEQWIARIDDALRGVRGERKGYYAAMDRARKGERIVWHSSKVGAGWLPEHLSLMQHSMESSAAWDLGFLAGKRYRMLRAKGKSSSEAFFAVAGLTVGDLTGVTNLVEAISGSEVITGRTLPSSERWMKGVLGVVSVAMLLRGAGPRLTSFAKQVGGTRIALVRTTGPFSNTFPVLLVGAAQRSLALTQAEVAVLAANGILQMSAVSSGGGTPPVKPRGLSNAARGKPRGGGGSKADRDYAKKVTGRSDAVYVDGVEFDGWDWRRKILLDAKRSRGPGSFYDISTADKFTKNVKIPEVLKQARRQLGALKGSGASGIEWHISDSGVATSLRRLFARNGINISVIHTPP